MLIEKLKKKNSYKELVKSLIKIAYSETQYRKKMGYPSIVGMKQANQNVLHRNSMLKKQIENNHF
ncbi:MAG: hypothetical protein DRJ09_04690 [Bacteroidetes bacterium]|nr:MAG: hypothetical protein DRJ09_04690 [Bacteroidota bacterium]